MTKATVLNVNIKHQTPSIYLFLRMNLKVFFVFNLKKLQQLQLQRQQLQQRHQSLPR
jgi:hypothetical protein